MCETRAPAVYNTQHAARSTQKHSSTAAHGLTRSPAAAAAAAAATAATATATTALSTGAVLPNLHGSPWDFFTAPKRIGQVG